MATKATTQRFLDIAEIKDDCVILRDGSLRAVLLVSSINFALKSEDEQKAIIQGYVNFLNTLNFPLQIVIQSRRLNIDRYIERLKEAEKMQTNELLRMQIGEYITYIKELIEMGEIMSKKFFIVVPYSPIEKAKGFFARLSEVLSAAMVVKLKRERFERYKAELYKRVDYIIGNLSGLGLKAVPLNTQSLIELYYNCYNPEIAELEKVEEVGKIRIEQ